MQKIFLFFLLMITMVPHKVSAQGDFSSSIKRSKISYSLTPDKSDEKNNGDLGNGIVFFNMNTLTGTNPDDDLGIKLKFDVPVKTFSTDIVECSHNMAAPVVPQVTSLAPTVFNVSCSQIKDDDSSLFSQVNCQLMDSCAQSKTSKDDMTYATYTLIPRMAAEDYVGLKLTDGLLKMEKLESLRKFAEKKYGPTFNTTCKSPFNFSNSKTLLNECEKNLVEDGFVKVTQAIGPKQSCFTVGPDYGKNIPENESALQSFINQKTESKVTDSLANDNESLEAIAAIMSSNGKVSDKLAAIYTKFKEMSADKKVDPVFEFDDASLSVGQMTQSPHYEFFKKVLSKNLTLASAKAELEKRRRDYTKEVFNGVCKSIPSYLDICKEATNISNGNGALYPNRIMAASRLKKVDAGRIATIKAVYPKSSLSDKDAILVLNAQRCVGLGVIPKRSVLSRNESMGAGYLPHVDYSLGGLGKDQGAGLSYLTPDFYSRGEGSSPDSSDVKRSTKVDVKIDLDDRTKSPGTNLVTKVYNAEIASQVSDKGISEKISDNLNASSSSINTSTAINNQNFHTPTYNTISNNLPVEQVSPAVDAPPEVKKSAAGPASAVNDKIDELTKKLTATEDNLARMKEEREDAEEQKVAQKKRDEDLQMISDLKKQINELKKETAKPSESETKTASASVESTASRSIASSRAPAIEQGNSDESENSARAIADSQSLGARNAVSPSNSASSSSAESASAMRAPAGGSGSVSSSGGRPVLVLSKTDGMSQEKFSESINDKIIELGGQSFEIEENGVKIEIVPEIKNGKVLLDDHGKPRYVKKVKNGKDAVKVKSRVPASVTDKADLKRIDEETAKRERAEYLKLKNITNQAIQKDN